jgi:glycosyltransferase involved in cell wall biosynthesis
VRVLIFGIDYFPESIGIGPYTTGMAEHYAKVGHEVRVATGVPHYPWWRAQPIPATPSNGVRLRRYRHFVPSRPTALGRGLYELTWLVSAARALPFHPADAVIGVVPTLSGAALAWLASSTHRARFGIVFQDLMGPSATQSAYEGGNRVATVVSATERFLARRADAVGIISEGFRLYLEQGGVNASRIVHLRNWARFEPPARSAAETRASLGWPAQDFICLHAGSMGQKQDLDNLLEAARLLDGIGVRIVLAGEGNDRARLVERAAAMACGSLLFAPLQEDRRFAEMLRAADVLLVNQRPGVREMALPSKLGAYFAAGRPVIAAADAESETAKEVDRSRAGRVVPPGEPDALARSLLELRSEPEKARTFGQDGLAYAKTYMTDSALAGYDRFLERLVAARP